MGVDNPAAKILVDMSKVQDEEVGDGTTSVTVLGNIIFTYQYSYKLILFYNVYMKLNCPVI